MRKLKDIRNNKNAKTLSGNFLALAILQVLRYLVPLIVLPYVTPIIGLEHFGEIAVASSFVLIVQAFVNYSFDFMGARDIARNKGDIMKVSEIVSTTLSAYLLIYSVMLFISIAIIFLVPKFRDICFLMTISLTLPIFSASVCEWFYQGMEQMQNITIVNVLSRFLFLLLVFLFINESKDYWMYMLFNTIGFVVASGYSLFVMHSRYHCRIRLVSPGKVWLHIKQGKDLFLNQVCVSFLNRMPNILLGIMTGSAAAGLYDAAFRLQDAGYHGVTTLNRTFFPFLARRMDKHKVYRRINLVFALILTIVLFTFAPIFVHLLYAPEFTPSTNLVRILSFSILFMGIGSAYGVNRLMLIGKEKLVRNITFCVSGSGLLLLVLMIQLFKESGAAISMVVVNLSLAVAYYLANKKAEDVHATIVD